MAWLLMFVITLSANGRGPSSETPEGVVRTLYARIVKTRPLGIPTGADRAALWPLLTPRLVKVLETAQRCEADYFRQHPEPDLKPEFGWLEDGLFSGFDEMALPSDARIMRTESVGRERYRVVVQFTYRESFETYNRPPDPTHTFQWRGEVMVERHGSQFLVDDFRRIDEGSMERPRALSETFVGCKGRRWVGDVRAPDFE